MVQSIQSAPLRLKIVVGLLAAYSIGHFVFSAVWFAGHSLGGDFLSAFPGPLAWKVAQQWPALSKPWLTHTYYPFPIWNYGPVLHVVTLPLLLVPTQAQAMQIVLWVDYGLVAATFLLWGKLLFPKNSGTLAWCGLACFWLNYFPLLEAITGREIELLELFLVSLALWWLRRNRQVAAGLAIGLAAMLKFLPGLFIPYFWIKGYRKAFWTAVGVVVVFMMLAQWTLGFEHSFTLSLMSQGRDGMPFRAAYANQAILNVLYKMFTIFDRNQLHPTTLYPYVLRPVGLAINVGILGAYGWLVTRWRHSRLLEVEWALLTVIMVLVPPHANTYYLVFALPAFSVAYAYLVRDPSCVGGFLKATLAVGAACAGFLIPMKVLEVVFRLPGVVVARVLQLYSLPAFGVIFAGLVLVELHRIARIMPDHSKARRHSHSEGHDG